MLTGAGTAESDPARVPVVTRALDDARWDALRHLLEDGDLELRVRGASMAPLLADGDRVRVRRRASRLPWMPGEILAFRGVDGRLVVHRLRAYAVARDGFRVKLSLRFAGDATRGSDPKVPATAVLGFALVRERGLFRRGRGLLRRAVEFAWTRLALG